MRILLALLALALAAPAAAAERRFPITDFERLIVEGPFIVRLAPGRTATATASGGQSALDRVLIDSQGTTLRIRRNTTGWTGSAREQGPPAVIELTARTLRSARLIGGGRLELGPIGNMDLDLVVQGSGSLSAPQLTVDNLSLGLVGSGRLEVGGRAEILRAEVQGTGDLDASALRAESATIIAGTAGAIAVGVTEEATVTSSGIGEVHVIGTENCTVRGPSADLVRCARSDQRQR